MMKTTRTNDTAKRMPGKRSRAISLLGAAGWLSLALGVLLFSFGAWKHYNAATAPITATYQDESVYVTASFGADAQIPKEAVLRAVAVTPEADPDAYSREMAAAMAAMGRDGETAPTNAIYNLGFFVGEQEVQPAAPVDVTVQLLRDGFAVGEPIQVVHFGEQAVEVIADTAVDEAGCVTFTAGGFSDFAFILGTPTTIANGTNLNEGGFIEFAQLVDSNGKEPENGQIELGKKYTYTVKFKENGDKQFTSPMTFKLPDGFVATGVQNMPIVMEDGTQIGTYSVDPDTGEVTFFITDEKYLTEHDDVWFQASFNMTAVGTKEGEAASFPWDGGKEKEFQMYGTPEVYLNKAAGEYDPVKHTIKYKVTLQIKKGSILEPSILDEMEQGMSLAEGTFTLKLYDENGKEIILDPQPTAEKTADGWKVENLPPLTKGQKVEIEYEAAVDLDNEDPNKKIEFGEGEDQYHFTVENTAKLDATAPGNQKIDGTTEDTETKTVDDLQLQKDGKISSGDTIDWEIAVGTGNMDVRGTVLTDKIGEGQWVDTNHDLEIKWKNGTGTMKTKTIKWKFKDGSVDTDAMAKEGVTDIVVDAQGRITSFNVKIPDADDPFWKSMDWQPEGHEVAWETGDWVKVEYYTKHDPVPEGVDKSYTNHVSGLETILPDGVDGQIVIGSGDIQKRLVKDVNDGIDDYIEYSISVKVPPRDVLLDMTNANGDQASESYSGSVYPYFYIQDQLEFPEDAVRIYDENGNPIKNRFFVNNIPEDVKIEAVDSNGETITFVQLPEPVFNDNDPQYYSYTVVPVGDGLIKKEAREFQIWFNTNWGTKDQGNHNNSLWPFEDEVTLTITYKVPGNSKLVRELEDDTCVETNLTLREFLEAGNNRLDNEVWGRFRHDDSKLKSEVQHSKTPEHGSVNKLAQLYDDNTIDYSVRFDNSYKDANNKDQDIHEFTLDEINNFTFMDKFDSKLEYVPGSLRVLVFSSGTTLRGYYAISDEEKNLVFEDDGTTTTMTATAKAFDEMHNAKASNEGIYDQPSLYEWLKNYQRSEDNGGIDMKDSRYVFQYTLRIKNEYLKAEDLTLDNVAHVMYGGIDLQDDAEVKTAPDIVDKFSTQQTVPDGSGNQVGTNEVLYTIEVNPGAINLAVGQDEATGQEKDLQSYEIEDVMIDGMTADWSSIHVYGTHVDEFGNEVGEKIELNWVDSDAEVNVGSNTFTVSAIENGMKFVVPDEIKLTITYLVTLDKSVMGSKPNGVNTVKLSGNIDVEETDNTVFEVTVDKVTTGASENFWLYKQDKNTKQLIDGSQFALYTQRAKSIRDSLTIQPSKGEGIPLYSDGTTYEPSATNDPTTHRPGTVIKKPEGAKDDDYYVLKETKAPDGYQIDPTPFVFKLGKAPDDGPEQVTVSIGGTDYTVTVHYYSPGDTIFVDNSPNAYVLPESGGNGLSVVLAGGLALILLSGLAMFLIKRRRAN